MLVIRQDTGLYRAAIPIGSNGVKSIITLPDGDLITGGGDGSIKRISGSDITWECVQQVCKYAILYILSQLLSTFIIIMSTFIII
jgi:hypothetical protein